VVGTVLVLSASLRFPVLDNRSLHHDEGVNVYLFASLWTAGVYEYDPEIYHGPTLPYLTLPFAWLGPARTLAETTERTFRYLPATLGTALALSTLLLAPGVGSGAAIVAALLCALSPAMVFYSRYYIHEIPLAAFTFGFIFCGWRYVACSVSGKRALGWAAGAGVFTGLMHATKETFVIAGASALAGLALAALPTFARGSAGALPPRRVLVRDATTFVVAWTGVSTLFFSSFGAHWRGVIDSVTTYARYFDQGTASSGPHVHPWHWYLSLLLYQREGEGPWFSEAPIVVLALVGAAACLWRRGIAERHLPLVRFFVGYSASMLAIYSWLSYKTPWCLLSFLHGMIVLAGVGATALWRVAPGRVGKVAACLLLAGCIAQLAVQTRESSFRHQADERNPYVYAQPHRDVQRLVDLIQSIATHAPERPPRTLLLGVDQHSNIVFDLRRVPGVRFVFGSRIPASLDAEVILVESDQEEELRARLQGPHHVEHFRLRPGVRGALYVRRELWEAQLEH
jgi:uncharacterized protein (TIGR03663 family)